MKITATFKRSGIIAVLLFAVIGIAACKSNITNLRQQVNPTYQVIAVDAEQRAAFDASVAALRQMGYKITRSGAAEGTIEAISSISAPDFQGASARQTTVSVRFSNAPVSGTAIEILFTEIQNDAFNKRDSLGTKQPLSDSPLYDVFKSYVTASLRK